MIAHCPACGTHYRHQILATPMRGRCGRCDAAIDLSRLRPYRLIGPLSAATAAAVAIDAERPVVAGTLAPEPEPVAPAPQRPVPSIAETHAWEKEDPLPPIPEMAATEIDLPPIPESVEVDVMTGAPVATGAEARSETAAPSEGRGTTWLLWVAAGAIAGTGISWTIGGTTLAGVAGGTLAGAIAGWGWLRWMSPR